MFCECIIVAGGSGSRMNSAVKKQFIKIKGKEIISRSIEVFQNCGYVDSIIIVAGQGDNQICNDIIQKYNYTKVKRVTQGGATRLLSVYNGLKIIGKFKSLCRFTVTVLVFILSFKKENAISARYIYKIIKQ